MRTAQLALLGLLVWLALSVPVAILAGKVLKARREQMERQARPVSTARQGPRAIRDHPAQRGPRAR